jgi:hypothetical protein
VRGAREKGFRTHAVHGDEGLGLERIRRLGVSGRLGTPGRLCQRVHLHSATEQLADAAHAVVVRVRDDGARDLSPERILHMVEQRDRRRVAPGGVDQESVAGAEDDEPIRGEGPHARQVLPRGVKPDSGCELTQGDARLEASLQRWTRRHARHAKR